MSNISLTFNVSVLLVITKFSSFSCMFSFSSSFACQQFSFIIFCFF